MGARPAQRQEEPSDADEGEEEKPSLVAEMDALLEMIDDVLDEEAE